MEFQRGKKTSNGTSAAFPETCSECEHTAPKRCDDCRLNRARKLAFLGAENHSRLAGDELHSG